MAQSLVNLKNLATGEQEKFGKDDIAGITEFVCR